MDVYKLKTTEQNFKTIERTQFEEDTGRRSPYYQPNKAGTQSQFAVCPACNNPIQIILLYPKKEESTQKPYGRHVPHDVEGIATYSQESYDSCLYAGTSKSTPDLKRKKSTVSSGILHILQEQFDRVVYLIGKMTGIGISSRLAEAMLRTYLGNEGYLYCSSNLMNIPWMLAYRSGSYSLFGQVVVDENIRESILKQVEGAYFNERNQLLCREGHFLNVHFCFVGHAATIEEYALKETMDFLVTQTFSKKPGTQYRDTVKIYRKRIEFDHAYFQTLIQLPEDHPHRKLQLVEMARGLIQA